MPLNMSFALTTDAIRNRTKDVTRRLGWSNLRSGERFWAVEKTMGLKKGEKLKRLSLLECVSNEEEPLWIILSFPIRRSKHETAREGFPHMSPSQFVDMFCREMRCTPEIMVRRIEFKYVEAT